MSLSMNRARSPLRFRSSSHSLKNEAKSVWWSFNRRGVEKLLLDELTKLLGDELLVAGNNRGVRNREPERVPEQRDDRVPVGQPSDDRSLRKGGEVAECGVAAFERARDDEQGQTPAKGRRGSKLNASQVDGALAVVRSAPPRRTRIGVHGLRPCEGRPCRRQMPETFG